MSEVKNVVSDEPTMAEVATGVTNEVVSEDKTIEEDVQQEVTSEVDSLINQDAVQAKINKIVATKGKEVREAQMEIQELKARLAEQTDTKQSVSTATPQLEDYDYDDGKHQEALIQYQVTKALDAQKQVTNQQQVEQASKDIADNFFNKAAEYAADHPEYDEDIKTLPIFKQDALEAIYELGPQVVHYLTKHLDVANEVANASPTMAAIKLGQISMGLSADSKIIKPSNAPEPVKVLTGGGAITKSQEDMSMDEIMALP